jgi:hypothetical protein
MSIFPVHEMGPSEDTLRVAIWFQGRLITRLVKFVGVGQRDAGASAEAGKAAQ